MSIIFLLTIKILGKFGIRKLRLFIGNCFLIIILVFQFGCNAQITNQALSNNENQPTFSQVAPQEIIVDETFKIVAGQTVYVPVYSHIYYETKQRSLELNATLSIRNTDMTNSIVVTVIDYYDSMGQLIKKHLANPIKLNPLASTDVIIERRDTTGGSGANFIVEWISQTPVSNPIIETVMISAISNQGISFVSRGEVIKSRVQENK